MPDRAGKEPAWDRFRLLRDTLAWPLRERRQHVQIDCRDPQALVGGSVRAVHHASACSWQNGMAWQSASPFHTASRPSTSSPSVLLRLWVEGVLRERSCAVPFSSHLSLISPKTFSRRAPRQNPMLSDDEYGGTS